MSRASILAGKAVIVVSVDNQVGKGLNSIKSSVAKIGYSLKRIGEQAMRGGIFSAIAIGAVVRQYQRFDDVMRQLAAKLEIVGTRTREQEVTMGRLETRIRSLSRAFGFSAVQTAEIAKSLAAAGFAAKQLEAALPAVIAVSKAGDYDPGETADMLANLAKTFDIIAQSDSLEVIEKKFTNLGSMLVKATNLGTIELSDLRESLKYVAGSANDLNIELPVLLGLLTQMSESGLKGSLAGTSLNTAFLNLIKNGKKLEEAIPGFKIAENANGTIDILKTFEKIFEVSNKMSDQNRVKLFADVFNIRGARAISAVQELDQVRKFIDLIGKSGQTVTLQAKEMEAGIGGALRRAGAALDAFANNLGRTTNTELVGAINAVTHLIDVLNQLTTTNKAFAISLVASPIILAGIAAGALSAAFALTQLAKAAGLARAVVGKVSGLAHFAIGSLGATAGAITKPLRVAQAIRMKEMAKHGKQITRLQLSIAKKSSPAKLAKLAAAQQGLATAKGAGLLGAIATSPGKIAGAAKALASGYKAASVISKLGNGYFLVTKLTAGLKALFSLKGLFTFGKGLFSIARGLGAVARFAFSWNAVGLAFNVLLLFGDRIPFVVNAFKALGDGLVNVGIAFKRMFQYLQPVLPMLETAFSAFSVGDNATGVQALADAFQAVTNIISNQLTAAWNAFMSKVAYIQVFFHQIGASIMAIIESLISSTALVSADLLAPFMQAFKGIGGEGGWTGIFSALVRGTDYLVSQLAIAWLEFRNVLYEWTRDAVAALHKLDPINGQARAAFSNIRFNQLINANKGRINTLRTEGDTRRANIDSIFKQNADAIAQAYLNNANSADGTSMEWSEWLKLRNTEAANALDAFKKKMADDEQRIKADGTNYIQGTPKPLTPGIAEAAAMNRIVSAITGSAMGTRMQAAIGKKKDTELLEEIRDNTADTVDAVETGGVF